MRSTGLTPSSSVPTGCILLRPQYHKLQKSVVYICGLCQKTKKFGGKTVVSKICISIFILNLTMLLPGSLKMTNVENWFRVVNFGGNYE